MATSKIQMTISGDTSSCKMSDGTLIQYGRARVPNVTSSGTSMTVNFPHTFIATPTVQVTPITGAPNRRLVAISNETTSSFNLSAWSSDSLSYLDAYWFAIGRWK